MCHITGRTACGFIAPQEMQWFLDPLRLSRHRSYIPLVSPFESEPLLHSVLQIESRYSSDGQYYLHRLVKSRACLELFTGPMRPRRER